jgi:ribulose-phosphate 3-epimerase
MSITKDYLLAPSLLSANFSRMSEGVKLIESCGGDWIHLDVMDGQFVPNITFGPKMVQDLRPITQLPLDVHLMIANPQNFIREFANAGSDYITIHYEACIHVHRVLQQIRDTGKKVGISIVPSTPAFMLSEVLGMVDLVLIMTVNPGFGGQSLIPLCLEKVRYLDAVRREKGYRYLISVDGGVNRNTAAMVREAGTDVLISGSAFFEAEHPEEEARLFKGIRVC